MNENEKYFEYKVSLRPNELAIGQNYIVDSRTSTVTLANGKRESVTWYQFKIPIRKYEQKIGGIADFKNIRFMRVYLTNFREPIHLRFGTFKLVRGDWRQYNRTLHAPTVQPVSKATMEVSTVNIEENGDRSPINYVLPPGVLRSLDPSASQATQQNEQALSLKLRKLAPGDARAVYRNTMLDLRRYKKLELFAHAERMQEEETNTANGELSLFIRLGSDYRNNYYEYSVPLSLTPYGLYSTDVAEDRRAVWPEDNQLRIVLEALTNLKTKRNRAKGEGDPNADFYKRFSEPDPNNPRNTISVIGNPTLSNVKTVMIGVRNNAQDIKSAEVWINELRLSDYLEKGGWAANTDVEVKVSDWGTVAFQGQMQSAGFGALDQTLSQRRMEDVRQMNLSANFEMGRFFPEKAHVTIPLYYAFTDELITPRYNPLDGDIELSEAIEAMATKEAQDSIRSHAITQTRSHAISLSNMRVGIRSKTPMPYDPANFSASYAYNQTEHTTPEYQYDRKHDWQASLSYDYAPVVLPLKPFKWIKSRNSAVQVLRSYQVHYLPSRISLSTSMMRHYSEQQVRNYIPGVGDAPALPATFIQNFVWNRDAALNWNLTSNLQFSFRSGTDARIEEPHVQVNRQLEPDKYKVWKDSVNQSILRMGTPMKYEQTANLTWKLPFSYIPYMNWITGSVSYTGAYNWDLGAKLPNGASIGNVIRNEMKLEGTCGINFGQLYRLIPFFVEVEKKVSQSGKDRRTRGRRTRTSRKEKTSIKPKKFMQTVKLKADSVTLVRHNLNAKELNVEAKREDGSKYKLVTRTIDKNTLEISTKDTISLELSIATKHSPEKKPRERTMFENHLLYSLMALRDINVTYSRTNNMNLPGFMPTIGAAGGQTRMGGILSPGLDFAFGLTGNDYVQKAYERGWLTNSQENINPSVFSQSENFAIRVNLEPIKDLRITLSANRVHTRSEETNYVFQGVAPNYRGNFTMTTIGLRGFFSTARGKDGYASEAFNQFLNNRSRIAGRYRSMYSEVVGDKKIKVRENSADVLIPAFISAYTQRGVNSMELNPFPSMLSLLPNWNITYTGLSKIPSLKKIFRNVSISHNYTSTYSVGSYASLLGWSELREEDNLPIGFLRSSAGKDLSQADPTLPAEEVASLPFDIPAVTIQEGFNPLIGLEVTLNNGVSLTTRWNKRRTMNLNITAYQLVESATDELTAGISYKVENFAQKIGLFKKKRRSKRKGNSKPLFTSGGAMTLRLDYAYNRSSMLIRKIQENFTQATNGNVAHSLKFSADYALSRMLTLRAYYDWNMNAPLVSTASFPTRNSNFGVSLRINLTQ